MTRPLCGLHPDPPDDRDLLFKDSPIVGAAPRTGAASYDWRQYDTQKIQRANSCGGHAIAGSAALCMAIAGTPIPFPSPLLPYTGGRMKAAGKGKPILDTGCNFRLAMEYSREYGLVSEALWPELAENINVAPPLDVFVEGDCARLEAYYAIPEGPGASEQIKAALARGVCPFFGMIVDEKYGSIGREVYDGPGGAVWGGHGQVIVAYSAILDAFKVRNTWADFGEDGYSWVSASFIDRSAFGMFAIVTSPVIR